MGFFFRKVEEEKEVVKSFAGMEESLSDVLQKSFKRGIDAKNTEIAKYSKDDRVFLRPAKPTIFSRVFWFMRGTFFYILNIIQFFFIYMTLGLFIHPIFSCLVTGLLMGVIWWVFFLWLLFYSLPALDNKYFGSLLWDKPKYLLITIPGFIVFYTVWIVYAMTISRFT